MKHLILLCAAAIAIAGVDAQPVVKPNGFKIFYHGKIFTSNPAQLLIEDGASSSPASISRSDPTR